MLRNKDIKKIDELKINFRQSWFEIDFLLKVIDIFKFSNLLNKFSYFKKQGYDFKYILTILLSLPFLGVENVYSVSKNKTEAKKDVFYRLKNNPNIDWRSILWLFVIKFTNLIRLKSSNNDGVKCLIIDDTFLRKSGKSIEKASKVWDHVSRRSLLGFKLNVLGYWDGASFIPVDFSLHREKGKNKNKPFGLSKKEMKAQYKKKRSQNSVSKEREDEADMSKIKTAIKMAKNAIKKKLKIDYILMDSWFTCNDFINAVRNVKNKTIHLIGMYSKAKTKFEYNGKMYTYSQLRVLLGKPKRNRKTGYYYLDITVLLEGKAVKLFFSKKGKNGKWKTFITTDINLSFIKMLEIYAIRWSIEVFFKESKQLLYLGKEQSTDFDSQIAAISLVMMQHILISVRFRFENYESKGELFRKAQVEIFRETLSRRLWGLLLEILNLVLDIFENEDADELVEKMFSDDKVYQKIEKFLDYSKIAA